MASRLARIGVQSNHISQEQTRQRLVQIRPGEIAQADITRMRPGIQTVSRLGPQLAFTLIELMIVLAIIGTLAALAIPAYQNYVIRAQVSEGLNLVGPFKVAIAEFHHNNGAFPADNADAGLQVPAAYTGRYVEQVWVANDVVSILYGNSAHARITGRTVELTAIDSQGSVSWDCTSGGAIPVNYMPSACR